MLPHRSPGLTSPSTFSGMPVRKVTASVKRRPAEPPVSVATALSAATLRSPVVRVGHRSRLTCVPRAYRVSSASASLGSPATPALSKVAISLRMRAEASMMLIESAAPVPSPRRICRSNRGTRPSSSSTTW